MLRDVCGLEISVRGIFLDRFGDCTLYTQFNAKGKHNINDIDMDIENGRTREEKRECTVATFF